MKGMLKKALAGVAAAALAVTGLAVGAGSAMAADGTVVNMPSVQVTVNGDADQLASASFTVYKIGDFIQYGSGSDAVYGVQTNQTNKEAVESALETATDNVYNSEGDALTWALSQTPSVIGQDNKTTWGYDAAGTSVTRLFANALGDIAASQNEDGVPTLSGDTYTTNSDEHQLTAVYDTDRTTLTGYRFSVEPGIYLIVSGSADGVTAVPMIVSTGTVNSETNTITSVSTDVTIEVKSNVAADKTKKVDKSSASIGDTLTFTLTGAITSPAPDSFKFTDHPGTGLTVNLPNSTSDMNGFSVTAYSVNGQGELIDSATLVYGTDYTVTDADDDPLTGSLTGGDSASFTVSIANPSKYAGKTIVVKYTATVNDDADVTNGVVNKLDNYGETTSDTTTTFTGFTLRKVNADEQTLSNVGFKIYDAEDLDNALCFTGSDGSYRKVASCTTQGASNTVTTNDNGEITVTGLGAGKYTVEEDSAPNGYLNVKAKFTVTVAADGTVTIAEGDGDDHGLASVMAGDDANVVRVLNVRNVTELPQTGAAGIALFVVLGLLIAGAGAAVWMKSRNVRNAING